MRVRVRAAFGEAAPVTKRHQTPPAPAPTCIPTLLCAPHGKRVHTCRMHACMHACMHAACTLRTGAQCARNVSPAPPCEGQKLSPG